MRIRMMMAVAAALGTAEATAGQLLKVDHPLPGRYIVAFDPQAMPGETTSVPPASAPVYPLLSRLVDPLIGSLGIPVVSQIASDLTSIYGGVVTRVFARALPGFVANLDSEQATQLAADWRVRYVEPDSMMHIQRGAVEEAATWGLDRIDQVSRPLDGRYHFDITGSNVHAYIVDTGMRSSHREFSGRVFGGYDGIGDGRGTTDCNGHGTHVAGILGGTTYGVAKQVLLHPVRVLDCTGGGPTSNVIAGIEWMVANRLLPAVANLSLGGNASQGLDDAVRGAVSSGMVFAVAAGNEASDACLSSPNRLPEALTVAATDDKDRRAGFSNTGACVDLFAPGVGITSAWFSSDIATYVLSGTSQAAPHAAGAAALYLSGHPQATPQEVSDALVAEASSNKVEDAGAGSPNKLLYTRLNPGTPPDSPPVGQLSVGCKGMNCDFGGENSFDDEGIVDYRWDFGDGTAMTGLNVTHEYAAPGTYQIQLTVTDTAGQIGSVRRQAELTSDGLVPCARCSRTRGTLNAPGDVNYTPSFTVNTTSVQRGYLQSPTHTNFELYLERLQGVLLSDWNVVINSRSPGNFQSIEFPTFPGTYRWRISSLFGEGPYEFFQQP